MAKYWDRACPAEKSKLVTYGDFIAKYGKEKEFRSGVLELMVQTCHLHWRVAGSCHENSVIASPQRFESTKSLCLMQALEDGCPELAFEQLRQMSKHCRCMVFHLSCDLAPVNQRLKHQIYADDPKA